MLTVMWVIRRRAYKIYSYYESDMRNRLRVIDNNFLVEKNKLPKQVKK